MVGPTSNYIIAHLLKIFSVISVLEYYSSTSGAKPFPITLVATLSTLINPILPV